MTTTRLGNLMIGPKSKGVAQESLNTLVVGGRKQESATTDDVRVMRIIGTKNALAELEARRQLPIVLCVTHHDIVRMRQLAGQI